MMLDPTELQRLDESWSRLPDARNSQGSFDRLGDVPPESQYPKGFLSDLRRLRRWSGLRGSLWRNPDLLSSRTASWLDWFRRVSGRGRAASCTSVLGLCQIALELARSGHDVTEVAVDVESVALATRAAERDPLRDERGALSYQVAEFPSGFRDGGPYDRVLFSRVLHHIEDPRAAVTRAAELLAPGGRPCLRGVRA